MALGAASLLLIVSVIVNPVDAMRTASLLTASVALWIAVPAWLSMRRIGKADI